MKRLVIKNELSQKENILNLIEHIKYVEKRKGLSKSKIIEKYTHGDCRCLVSLIQHFFPEVKSIMFTLDEEDFHCVAGLDLEGDSEPVFFDINGAKSFNEVCVFMLENYRNFGGEITCTETGNLFIKNDISQIVLDSVEFESVEQEKQ